MEPSEPTPPPWEPAQASDPLQGISRPQPGRPNPSHSTPTPPTPSEVQVAKAKWQAIENIATDFVMALFFGLVAVLIFLWLTGYESGPAGN